MYVPQADITALIKSLAITAEHKQALTSEAPAEHKQAAPEQAAERPPAVTALTGLTDNQTAFAIEPSTAEPIYPSSLLPEGTDKHLGVTSPMAIARAVEGGHTSYLGFLRPAGSIYCQTDSILQEAVSRFRIEDTLLSNKMGISGLQDLYQTTVDRHAEL